MDAAVIMVGASAHQLARKEWRVVSETAAAAAAVASAAQQQQQQQQQPRDSRVFRSPVSKSGSNYGGKNAARSSRMFRSSADGSENSSDSDQLISDSGASNYALAAEDSTIYDIKHVQQSNGQVENSLSSVSVNSDIENSEGSIPERLHEITRQREQLQQLEIELKTRFIVNTELMRLRSGFDEQAKQHASIVAELQEQIKERDNHIQELQQQLEERQRQLHANQLEASEAVSQVWAKDGLLREQNNELASLRREREAALSENKVMVAQLDSERSQHAAEIQELKEQLREKDRQIQEMEEQNRAAQDMILYKDEQLREAQAWATRVQELDAIRLNSSHTLQAELRDRTDQLNQLWLGCQKQLADAEKYYTQTIQHLQMELAEAKEQCKSIKDGSGPPKTEEKKIVYSDNKCAQFEGNGEIGPIPSKSGNSVASNSQAKVGIIQNGSLDGPVPAVLFRDMPAKMDHAAGVPVAPSPVYGVGHILPSDPMGMIHQFGVHQQGIPQALQPAGVQVAQPAFGQFQSVPAIVPQQQLMPSHHQQPIHHNHHYLHQHQPMPIQRLPSRQQSHASIPVCSKGQVLHTKKQDLQRHAQQSQTESDIVDTQKEQQVQRTKEHDEDNVPSLLQQEYDHSSHTEESRSLQQPEHSFQQGSQGMLLALNFKSSDQSRCLDQQQLSLMSQPQIKVQDSTVDLGVSNLDFECQRLAHLQNKSTNRDQLTSVSRASQSMPFANSVGFQSGESDCKAAADNADVQISAKESPQKQNAVDGHGKVHDPPLLDERSLLACFVRVIPAEAGARIRISSTLPNRLGKMLAPHHWHDYRRKYGRLDDFVSSHPELFVVEGDYIHLREGAHATISATTTVAKVAAAAAAAASASASPVGTARMPTVAVTPVAHAQINRLRKGSSIIINSKEDAPPQIAFATNNQYHNHHHHHHHMVLKESQSQTQSRGEGGPPPAAVNGICEQITEVPHAATAAGVSSGRISMTFENRQGRPIVSGAFIDLECGGHTQKQSNRIQ